MDDKKDIQKADPLFRFFDKQAVRTNPFGSNQSADRAYRRTERLVAAVFLVTNHISSDEPVRVAVRTGALKLLEQILTLRDEMRADSWNVMNARALIRQQISLVRMLAVAGFLSHQNASILIEGFDELGGFLNTAKNSPLSETFVFSQENLSDVREGHIKDTAILRDKVSIKDTSIMSDISSDKRSLRVREESIIAVLRGGGELALPDIASNLPEYSEKKIQRSLVELIEAGRVKKTGLKRWSRYSVLV